MAILALATVNYSQPAAAQVPQWTAYYDGPGSGDDKLAARVVDGAGFVYMTGLTRVYGAVDGNIWTIKLSPDGIVEWENRFNGTANRNDFPNGIVVDQEGNVIVCGASWVGSAYSMVTIKYGPEGSQAWASFYKHQSNSRDVAFCVAADADGNAYVAGRSYVNQSYIKLLRYDSNGSLVWSTQYSEPLASSAEPIAMVIDHAGNIVVACHDGFDYLLLKYGSDGLLIWDARYDTPEHGNESPRAMGIDKQDNIYVTGSGGIYPDRDFITVSFDANGSERWVARHTNGPGLDDFSAALAMDPSGAVIVAGTGDTSANQPQCLTLKYSLDGVQQWLAVFPSGDDGYAYGSSVAMTPTGLIQVSGAMLCGSTYSDFFVVQYEADGTDRWQACYNGPADWIENAEFVATDAAGNVYASGNSNGVGTWSDIATVKYNENGTVAWTNRYNVVGRQHDWPAAIAEDSLGNVYVGGTSQGTETLDDFVVVKHEPNGISEWATRYSSEGPHYDRLQAMTVDSAGNVYVGGSSQRADSDFAVIVVAVDQFGGIRWVSETDMPTPGNFDVSAITMDPRGNILVAATFFDVNHVGQDGALVMKFDAEGQKLWSTFIPADTIELGGAKAMAVDFKGNVTVAVSFYRQRDPEILDTLIVQYNKNGNERWSALCDGPAHTGFLASSLAVSSTGDVFVSGTTVNYPLAKIELAKFDRHGSQQWATTFDDGSGANEYAHDMAIDSSDNAVLTGVSIYYSDSDTQVLTVKYDSNGQRLWNVRDDCYLTFGINNRLGVDEAANIFVSYTVGGSSRTRPAVRMLDTNGNKFWSKELPSQPNSRDAAFDLSFKTPGIVYLLSNSFRDGSGSDLATTRIDYCPTPGDINTSGALDGLDVQSVVACLLGDEIVCRCADVNFDGIVNQLDIPILVSALLR